MTEAIPILLYHSVSDLNPRDVYAVSPARFADHIGAMRRSGRTPMTITELAEGLRGLRSLPARPMAVTFDDGYADSYRAIEALRDLDIKATLYVTTGQLSEGRGISRSDVVELARLTMDVEVGAHSVTHARLDELDERSAQREIVTSRHVLEQVTGRAVKSFAYPHGAYNARVRQLVIDAGFESAAAVKNALSHALDDPWAIARWTVRGSTTAEQVAAILRGSARIAWSQERLSTRAYRSARRLRRRVIPTRTSVTDAPYNAVAPVAIRQLDTSTPFSGVAIGTARSGEPYRTLAFLVRDGREVRGWATFPAPSSGVLSPDALMAEISTRFDVAEDARVLDRSEADLQSRELISVIVPTCAQTATVVRCVRHVKERAIGPHEVVVVENRPAESDVRGALVEAFGLSADVRYVDAYARGLSNARNAGLAAARGDFVAFVDDDIVVDDHWMEMIRCAFASEPTAGCVTGLILPLELETAAQLDFERFAGFSKGFQRRVFAIAQPPTNVPMFPYAAGHFGSGANMAFRRQILVDLGGFDPRLGTGTVTRGAEDLDVYVRLILAGGTIVYEPRAIAWHRHPEGREDLDKRAFDYGVGLGAWLAKLLITSPNRRKLLTMAPQALVYFLSAKSRKNAGRNPSFPGTVRRLELAGLAFGPVAYIASRRNRPADGQQRVDASTSSASDRAVWSGQLELTAPRLPALPLRTPEGRIFDAARVLIRVAGAPIGFIELNTDRGVISQRQILDRAAVDLGPAVGRELEMYGVGPRLGGGGIEGASATAPYWLSSTAEKVSVVVCTRNRPEGVRRCLESIKRLRYPNIEVVIVDNAPADRSTEAVVREHARHDRRIRYVREERPGLSCARNRGLAEAVGEFLAFTDDDVRVDPLWLDGILRGFARRSDVACVTGLVASSSLEHPAERYFDGRVWWSSNCEHRLYTIKPDKRDSPLHPYAAGAFGTGANIAFRTSVLSRIGGFDECLGAGSPTGGGEDLDIFVRVLRAGYALSYESCALVWHDHRIDESSLREQMRCYGRGLGAYLTKYLASRRTRPDVAKRLLFGLVHGAVLAARSIRTGRGAGVDSGLLRAEVLGLLEGPKAYARARRAQDAEHLARVAPW